MFLNMTYFQSVFDIMFFGGLLLMSLYLINKINNTPLFEFLRLK